MKAILFLTLLGVALSLDYYVFNIKGISENIKCDTQYKRWFFYFDIDVIEEETRTVIKFPLDFAYPNNVKAECYGGTTQSLMICGVFLDQFTLDVDHIELPATAPSGEFFEINGWEIVAGRKITKGLPCPPIEPTLQFTVTTDDMSTFCQTGYPYFNVYGELEEISTLRALSDVVEYNFKLKVVLDGSEVLATCAIYEGEETAKEQRFKGDVELSRMCCGYTKSGKVTFNEQNVFVEDSKSLILITKLGTEIDLPVCSSSYLKFSLLALLALLL